MIPGTLVRPQFLKNSKAIPHLVVSKVRQSSVEVGQMDIRPDVLAGHSFSRRANKSRSSRRWQTSSPSALHLLTSGRR